MESRKLQSLDLMGKGSPDQEAAELVRLRDTGSCASSLLLHSPLSVVSNTLQVTVWVLSSATLFSCIRRAEHNAKGYLS